MFYAYLLQSQQDPTKRYVGFTTREPDYRLAEHNAGKSTRTNKHKPWKVVAYFAFDNQQKTENFERYIKQGSSHAFANKHFW